MRTKQLKVRTQIPEPFRSRWLQTIREYVCDKNLPPVFRYQPGTLILGTDWSGGSVTLEGSWTGILNPTNILAWPLVSASVTGKGKARAVELFESLPGVACGPLEVLWRVQLPSKIAIPANRIDTDQEKLRFEAKVIYTHLGIGFELLSDAHLLLLYEDVIAARPDLKLE